ncbi:MAG: hypothetical protein AAF992_00785 [Bacteroidota bacterium]|mgnify:CR=1 FL=1
MNTTQNFLSAALGMFICMGVAFQSSAQSHRQETELLQSIWGMEKQALVKEYMGLNETESAAFWPIYEEYSSKLKSIGAKRIDNIMDYANNYENMTPEKASQIANTVFKNNISREKLQQQYFKKLSKAIGALKATEFMQLEKYLQSVINMEIQQNIPFLKELEDERES